MTLFICPRTCDSILTFGHPSPCTLMSNGMLYTTWISSQQLKGNYISQSYKPTQNMKVKVWVADCRLLTGCPTQLLSRHVRPANGATRELHVSNECLDGCLADQSHEEELRYEVCGDSSQWGQTEKEATETLWLSRILHAFVFSQRHLSLLLQTLHVGWVCQSTCIY